jgi:Flp pilus assembly protein TadG
MKDTTMAISQILGKLPIGVRARRFFLHDQRGNAMVELALGVSLCSALIVGAAEFGWLAYQSIEVSNAARAGVQYGAQSRTDAADTAHVQTAATQDAPDVSGIAATASYFCQCSNGGTSTCAATDCSTSRIIYYAQVNTSATVKPLITLPLLPKSYALIGKAVMRVEQ